MKSESSTGSVQIDHYEIGCLY